MFKLNQEQDGMRPHSRTIQYAIYTCKHCVYFFKDADLYSSLNILCLFLIICFCSYNFCFMEYSIHSCPSSFISTTPKSVLTTPLPPPLKYSS